MNHSKALVSRQIQKKYTFLSLRSESGVRIRSLSRRNGRLKYTSSLTLAQQYGMNSHPNLRQVTSYTSFKTHLQDGNNLAEMKVRSRCSYCSKQFFLCHNKSVKTKTIAIICINIVTKHLLTKMASALVKNAMGLDLICDSFQGYKKCQDSGKFVECLILNVLKTLRGRSRSRYKRFSLKRLGKHQYIYFNDNVNLRD